MRPTLMITTLRRQYFAGEVLEGVASLNVQQAISSVRDVRVTLAGTETAKVPTSFDDGVISERNVFFAADVEAASLGGNPVGVGHHTWSFSVELPRDLPATMKTGQRFNSMWGVRYEAQVKIDATDPSLPPDGMQAKVAVVIRGAPEDEEEARASSHPALAEPKNMPLRSCLCLPRGSVCLGFLLNQTSVEVGGPLRLSVVARNDSPTFVSDMKIRVVQEAEWRARGITARQTRVVSTLTVRGRTLDSCFAAKDPGLPWNSRAPAYRAAADAASERLSADLRDGRGTPFTTMVPETILEDVGPESGPIKLGRLATRVEVSLSTGSLFGPPTCRHPIRVVSRRCGSAAAAAVAGTAVAGTAEAEAGEAAEATVVDPEAVAVAVWDDASDTASDSTYAHAVVVLDGFGSATP